MTAPTITDGATPTGETSTAPAVSGATTTSNTTFAAQVAMTRDELNRQLDEAKRAGEKTARESDEIKQLRAKAKRADDLEEAQKTEVEKLADRATKAEALAAENATKYRTALIRSSFTTAAITAGIPADRVDAALKLADMTSVDVDAAGNVSGLDAAVKSLPAWLSVAPTNGSGIPATPKADTGAALTEADEQRRRAGAAAQVRSRF